MWFSVIVTWLRNSADHVCVTGGLCHVLRSLALWGRSGGDRWSILSPLDGELCCCYACLWWGTGRDQDPRKSGEGAVAYLRVHCHRQKESALRWAVALAVRTCRRLRGAKVTRHKFWRGRRAEVESNRSLSAYQLCALLLGQIRLHELAVPRQCIWSRQNKSYFSVLLHPPHHTHTHTLSLSLCQH